MDASKPQIRGKDLVGGVMVMPMGLDAAIKKRTSGEFKMEQNDGSMSFSNTSQQSSSSMKKETRQLASFQEESSGSSFNQQQSFQSMQSSMQSSQSMTQSSTFQSSAQQQSSSSMSMSSSKTMSSKTSSQSMTSSSLTTGFTQENQLKDVTQEWESKLGIQNTEIKQDNLKTQIVSAITDLEGDRDLADFGKENKTIDLMSPPQAKSPTPKNPTFTPTKQDPFSPPKNDVFSPPPLERFEPPQQQQQQQLQQQPQQLPELPLSNGSSHPQPVPTRNGVNGLQNGFNEFVSTSKNMEMQQIEEFSQSTRINGKFEECGSIQESNSSNSLLQKIMTPAPVEYDTNSLKKKDPKKMFTDSSFYNSKYHPTIADQVEMAHKLSSAMFNEQNKGTKGAKMYLTRMENSGGFGDDIPKHDNVPNMKLVMNPEGKVHLWDDLPADQRPDYQQIAVHAAPNLDIPEVKDPVAESLNAGIGKGEKSFYRPSTFVSAYRQVFDQNRGVFGSQAVLKTPESPGIVSKHSHTPNTNNSPFNTKQSLSNENYKTFGDKQMDNKVGKIPESPKAPPRKQTLTTGTSFSEKTNQTKPQSVTINTREKVNLKRHKSFHEDKNLTDQRKTKYFIEPSSNINVIKPSDVLKTPYLLPTVYTNSQNNYNNFPQINSTSMVSKTKALFEEKDRNQNFIPLGKSRTFSAFSTEIMKDSNGSECPLTPSVPKRKSSRNVFASYKSMNSNMNNCGVESMTTSPMTDRRIPMRKFF